MIVASAEELLYRGYAIARLSDLAGSCLSASVGVRVPVLLGAFAFNREPLECVCFIVDITAQKQAEWA